MLLRDVWTVTAADYLAEAADAHERAAEYRALTEQHTHLGRVFDYAQPLPPQPTYRPREWETDVKDKP